MLSNETFNNIFYLCVQLLRDAAKALDMSYEEINIWIFVIIEPIVFFLMCIWIIYLLTRVRTLKLKAHA